MGECPYTLHLKKEKVKKTDLKISQLYTEPTLFGVDFLLLFCFHEMKPHTSNCLREFSHLKVTKIDVIFSVGYTR